MPHHAPNPLGLTAADLAPGDARAAEMDWSGFSVAVIESPADPRLDLAYEALWAEFGPAGEMETRAVLAERLAWTPLRPHAHHAMMYSLVAVFCRGELAAVRDHTVVVDLTDPAADVVVHLSHLLIAPRFRGSGLGGWLRALPVRTARDSVARAGQAPRPVTLVAEMEPPDPLQPQRLGRLAIYERIGFKKIDPRQFIYLQPDFRPPDVIDRDGRTRPVPLALLTRRVGREAESFLPAPAARALVAALYHAYARTFRAADMAPLWARLDAAPFDTQAPLRLVPPTHF